MNSNSTPVPALPARTVAAPVPALPNRAVAARVRAIQSNPRRFDYIDAYAAPAREPITPATVRTVSDVFGGIFRTVTVGYFTGR